MRYEHPEEAVPLGTLVRSTKLNRLGIVTEAYYDEEKVLNYSCFFMPNTAPGMYYRNLMSGEKEIQGIISEETEFDLIFYLMVGKIDLEELDIFHVPGGLVI
jgi:hypothetical protein